MVLVNLFIASTLTLFSIDLSLPYSEYYHHWPFRYFFLFILLMNFGIGLEKFNIILIKNVNKISIYSLVIYGAFIFVILFFGKYVDGRLSFLFGPNMLYRFVVVMYLINFYLFFYVDYNLKIIHMIALAVMTIIVLSEIGSKGGGLIFSLFSLIMIIFAYKLSMASLVRLITLAFIVIIFVDGYLIDSRIFQLNNLTDSIRFSFILQFLIEDIGGIGVFGEDWFYFEPYSDTGFMYPHMSLIELILYYGLIGYCLIVVVFLSFIFGLLEIGRSLKYKKIQFESFMIIIYFVVLFASFFSGDLNDNFSIIAFAFYGVYKWRGSSAKYKKANMVVTSPIMSNHQGYNTR